jgi:predicted nucleic acid-binding protein
LSGQVHEAGMLIDTDVLIEHLRGNPNATRRLDELDTLTLSAVSYLEILQGMRNKAELLAVQKMLDKRSATLLPITWIERRGVRAVIAATVDTPGLTGLQHSTCASPATNE